MEDPRRSLAAWRIFLRAELSAWPSILHPRSTGPRHLQVGRWLPSCDLLSHKPPPARRTSVAERPVTCLSVLRLSECMILGSCLLTQSRGCWKPECTVRLWNL